MHCPSCGAETTLEQRFCRGCGMDLETVSKLVAAHSSPETLKLEKSGTDKVSRQRMYQSFKWGLICFILGMAALATTKTLSLDKTFNLGPLLLLFLGMGNNVLWPARNDARPCFKFEKTSRAWLYQRASRNGDHQRVTCRTRSCSRCQRY